ncbi:MAG: hypothetical protein IJ015_05655 [Ruminococcus sp.]|nr:hypothetical protein [Ruminococcus sp.]
MQKLLSILIVLALVFSSCTVAFATEIEQIEETSATYNEVILTDFKNKNQPTEAPSGNSYPQITSASAINGGLKISWEEFEGASAYRLYLRTTNGLWRVITTTTSLSYNHTGLSSNQNYTYTLAALDNFNNNMSYFNEDGWTFSLLDNPVIKTVSSETNGLKITWNKVDGAKNYKVYKRVNSSWVTLGYTTDNKYTDTSVNSGYTYSYTIRCVTEDGKYFTSFHNAGKIGKFVATPEITKVENTASGSKIYWTKVNGASKYRVFYKAGNGWKGITTTSSTSCTHSPLSNNSNYTYTVRACNSNGSYISSYNKTGFNNTFLTAPVIKSVSSVHGGLQIKWNAVSGAENYRIYVKTASSWKGLGNTTDTSFTDTTVKSSNSYTYTVRCISKDGRTVKSYYNTKGMAGTYYETPVIKKIENTRDGVKITWNKVSGVSQYKLFYKLSDGSGWKTISTTTSDNSTHKPLSDKDTYTYTVRGCNSKGAYITGYDKEGITNSFIAPIEFTSITSNNGNMILNWDDHELAYQYRVYRKAFSGTWVGLDNVTASYYTDKNAPKNTPYTYTLRCMDKDGSLISSYIDNNKYYYNGKLADGKITYNDSTYNFTDGHLTQGYVRIDSKLYYYDKNGKILKNTIVGTKSEGYYYADENGVCCESEEMRLAAEFVMNHSTGSTYAERMKTGFNYLARNYTYLRTYDHPTKASDIPKQAIDMFKNKKGNCFKYASAFACIAKACGYRSRVVVGTTPGFGIWTPHGWTEVYVNGKWLVCDPDFQMSYPSIPYYYYMTDGARIPIRVNGKFEITISNGQATWK